MMGKIERAPITEIEFDTERELTVEIKLEIEMESEIERESTVEIEYMAPEYALQGTFTPKSDVCSFGIFVKKLWNDGRIVEVKDPKVGDEEWPEEELRSDSEINSSGEESLV
ncbi:hypothetical protein ZIOFF_041221 [Zingiber officinale]|uniref:Serine-threonine/tyrosine-protein kinase catalytic domain-containing protein n=1 Tax=Zingiber officinale TaxID=94328 RepID=A0A8J5L1I4_ZINOF|nr:hypothetical protein ZIOFF_041221 [Zingiber officinale]